MWNMVYGGKRNNVMITQAIQVDSDIVARQLVLATHSG